MIAMMIIMILTNKEWCRFIANNVVQEPLSLKLPMCVLLAGVTCMYECVCVCLCYHLPLWLKIKADCLLGETSFWKAFICLPIWPQSFPFSLEESRTSRNMLTAWFPLQRESWDDYGSRWMWKAQGMEGKQIFWVRPPPPPSCPAPHPCTLPREGHCWGVEDGLLQGQALQVTVSSAEKLVGLAL